MSISTGTFAAVGLLKKMRWASEVLGPGVMQGAAVARWTQEHRGHLLQMLADNLPRYRCCCRWTALPASSGFLTYA
jgi:hypothetical protein